MDLLGTFVSHRFQPLRQREMTMWRYTRPCCLDRPFSTELDDTEINTWILGGHAHGADQNFGSGPVPLREWVVNRWVSVLKLTSSSCVNFSFPTHMHSCVGSWVHVQRPVEDHPT
jgi:hypothetical protein